MDLKHHDDLNGYAALNVEIKTGDEHFHVKGRQLDTTLLDFWRWSASDLVNNTLRGRLAEYLVAQALGVTSSLRAEWDSYDLISSTGVRIEVKSAAYLQSWYHNKLSPINFGIRPTSGWDAATSLLRSSQVKRQADVYVFCLLHHQDKQTIDPLNLDQWTFYTLPTSRLNEVCPTQKTITLKRLLQVGAQGVQFDELLTHINQQNPKPDRRFMLGSDTG